MISTKWYRNVRDNRSMGIRHDGFRTLARFGTPRTFNPDLTFPEACVAVTGALARIFLGSLLFAICGALMWHSWATIQELQLRVIVEALLALTFLLGFAALMIASGPAVDGMMTRVRGTRPDANFSGALAYSSV